MADADEDVIHAPSVSQDSSGNIDNDLSDETQDFRFLSNLSFLSDSTQQPSLPRRGEKDFEPNPTLHQSDALAASRLAMHNALAHPRLHHPNYRVVGIYYPEGMPASVAPAAGSTSTEVRQGKESAPARTTCLTDFCVCVLSPRGQLFRTMGKADRQNRMWLLPEEALYLLERGSLDIRWTPEEGDEEEEEGIPMSLQAAYSCFIGTGGLTLERYSVFSGLRRGGYAVIRAQTWNETSDERKEESRVTVSQAPAPSGLTGLLGRLFKSIYDSTSTCNSAVGPLVGLGIHRNYESIHRSLALIPSHHGDTGNPAPSTTTPPFRLAFDVYKPSTPFKKSVPGTPDFRLAVINARTTNVPTLAQLSALLESTPLQPPRGEKMDRMTYMRLRHGWRNVILAVVDQGVVSFLRVGDAAFGGERVFEEKAAQGRRKGGFSGRGKPRSKGSAR